MDRLTAMSMFVRVVETGSFSAVARELNTTQPTVSKNIAELEAHLGAKLLNRSTRHLRLTELGADYYERSLAILRDVEEAEQAAGHLQSQPRGTVRISCATAFARLHVIPHLPGFFESYPDIHVEVRLADRVVDLVEEGLDVALRMGKLPDSTLVARHVGNSPVVTVASPQYLKNHGIPHHPRELRDHDCLIYTAHDRAHELTFAEDGQPLHVRVDGPLHTNSSEGIRAALQAHLGVAMVAKWLVGDLLASGELVSVLDDFQVEPSEIHAVYPSGRHLPSKVRSFLDYLAEQYSRCPLIA